MERGGGRWRQRFLARRYVWRRPLSRTASRESEVEVSLSTVIALNDRCTLFGQHGLQGRRGNRRVGKGECQHEDAPCRGRSCPRPSPCRLRATSTPPSIALTVATFGKVSVVMIALAASRRPSGDARAKSASSTPSNFDASSGSPITPVEARKTSLACEPTALPATAAVSITVACPPPLPVNALALPD